MILNLGTTDIIGAKSLDLSYEVNEFKTLCFNWETYKNDLNTTCSVSIQHVRK